MAYSQTKLTVEFNKNTHWSPPRHISHFLFYFFQFSPFNEEGFDDNSTVRAAHLHVKKIQVSFCINLWCLKKMSMKL